MEKGVGNDDFQVKFVKYANEKIQSVVAETYDTKTKSEDFPREIKTKLLIP